jgi:hypothetical protein
MRQEMLRSSTAPAENSSQESKYRTGRRPSSAKQKEEDMILWVPRKLPKHVIASTSRVMCSGAIKHINIQ